MRILFIFITIFSLISCGGEKSVEPTTPSKPKIVCTTGMIGDAVQNLVGDVMEVTTLMGPGVDPHLYKPTQADIDALMEAEVIVYNGLHLEGKMAELFGKLKKRKEKLVLQVSDGIPHDRVRRTSEFATGEDPHIWFDVELWNMGVAYLTKELAAYDSTNTDYIQNNFKTYTDQLFLLHSETAAAIQKIPEDQRILITAHDAFGYYGLAYGLTVRGLQGISTVSEFGLKDRIALTDYIVENKIKAVFVESSVPHKAIEAVMEGCAAAGHDVAMGGTLYSDALGAADTPAGKYIGMIKANTETIVNALK